MVKTKIPCHITNLNQICNLPRNQNCTWSFLGSGLRRLGLSKRTQKHKYIAKPLYEYYVQIILSEKTAHRTTRLLNLLLATAQTCSCGSIRNLINLISNSKWFVLHCDGLRCFGLHSSHKLNKNVLELRNI